MDERLLRFWRDGGLARARGTDGPRKLIRGDILEQVANSACLERALDQIILREAGEGYHLDFRVLLPNGLGGGGAVHIRHDQVHQHHVWLDLAVQPYRFPAVAGLTNKIQVIKRQQERGQPAADNGMVVHEHDADGLDCDAGRARGASGASDCRGHLGDTKDTSFQEGRECSMRQVADLGDRRDTGRRPRQPPAPRREHPAAR